MRFTAITTVLFSLFVAPVSVNAHQTHYDAGPGATIIAWTIDDKPISAKEYQIIQAKMETSHHYCDQLRVKNEILYTQVGAQYWMQTCTVDHMDAAITSSANDWHESLPDAIKLCSRESFNTFPTCIATELHH